MIQMYFTLEMHQAREAALEGATEKVEERLETPPAMRGRVRVAPSPRHLSIQNKLREAETNKRTRAGGSGDCLQ